MLTKENLGTGPIVANIIQDVFVMLAGHMSANVKDAAILGRRATTWIGVGTVGFVGAMRN